MELSYLQIIPRDILGLLLPYVGSSHLNCFTDIFPTKCESFWKLYFETLIDPGRHAQFPSYRQHSCISREAAAIIQLRDYAMICFYLLEKDKPNPLACELAAILDIDTYLQSCLLFICNNFSSESLYTKIVKGAIGYGSMKCVALYLSDLDSTFQREKDELVQHMIKFAIISQNFDSIVFLLDLLTPQQRHMAYWSKHLSYLYNKKSFETLQFTLTQMKNRKWFLYRLHHYYHPQDDISSLPPLPRREYLMVELLTKAINDENIAFFWFLRWLAPFPRDSRKIGMSNDLIPNLIESCRKFETTFLIPPTEKVNHLSN